MRAELFYDQLFEAPNNITRYLVRSRRGTGKAAVAAVDVPDDVIGVLTALRDHLQVCTLPAALTASHWGCIPDNLLSEVSCCASGLTYHPQATESRTRSFAVCLGVEHPVLCDPIFLKYLCRLDGAEGSGSGCRTSASRPCM